MARNLNQSHISYQNTISTYETQLVLSLTMYSIINVDDHKTQPTCPWTSVIGHKKNTKASALHFAGDAIEQTTLPAIHSKWRLLLQ